MNTEHPPMYEWKTLPWRMIERRYLSSKSASTKPRRRGNQELVHKLQRLLIRSWSAKCLAVRRVTQENQGKKTAGVDGDKIIYPPTPDASC